MTAFRTLDDASLAGKRVLLRVDLNVPTEHGRVTDATRIERVLPTIHEISHKGGKAILLAHFGRPKGGPDEANSLKPVAAAVAELLKQPVAFASDCVGEAAAKAIAAMKDGDVVLLENTRFHKGEEKNDPPFVTELAKLGDLYVNDAFSAAHRAHASTEALAHHLPAYAGRAMQAELEALAKALETPKRPLVAIVGGAKVSTKLDLLGNLVAKVDALVIGGGMANTFLHAQGIGVGKSLAEKDLAATALRIIEKADAANCAIILPVDAVVAFQFAASAFSRIRSAVAARSFSASDLPIPTPCACRKVLAMPPPMTSASTLLTRFSSRSILVETLAPPMIAITGLVGASSALFSASSSACMVRPA